MTILLESASTSMFGKQSAGKAAKKFLDYINKHGFPKIDDDSDGQGGASVLIDCSDAKFYDFIKKLAKKFDAEMIVNFNKSPYWDVKVWLYDSEVE